MAPPTDDDDWSSDEEAPTGAESASAVILGVPGGPVDDEKDMIDAAVSRIGGQPALIPTTEPPFSSSFCKICREPMELLLQLWCPDDKSPNDRALYIWGCSRSTCQTKSTATGGSVRAWRGLRLSPKKAAKIAKQKEREKARAEADAGAEKKRTASKTNPFSMTSSPNNTGNPFGTGLADSLFGAKPTSASQGAEAKDPRQEEDEDYSEDGSDEDSEKSLVTALASTSIEDSPWKTCPQYPPQYLEDDYEDYHELSPSRSKLPKGVKVEEDDGTNNNAKDMSWMSEAYENSLNVDPVFEKFSKRVAHDGDQCLRYEIGGTPLPFSTDRVFNALFPAPKSDTAFNSKSAFKVTPTAPKRTYDPSSAAARDLVPACPACGSRRVFECQIMPNLINICVPLRSPKEGEKERGMEWGTCLVFSCEEDCCLAGEGEGGEGAKECWREEVVLIQWDQ